MKTIISLFVLFLTCQILFSAGVIINKNVNGIAPILLVSSAYDVDIQNQVAVVTCTEVFQNNAGTIVRPLYYFPIPREAGATQLRWQYNEVWHTASIDDVAQNPGGGASNPTTAFVVYVGLMPVMFDFGVNLNPGESILVELTYDQLLNDTYGIINLTLRNDYSLIQTLPLQLQSVHIDLVSDRTIESFTMNNTSAETTNNGLQASAVLTINNSSASLNHILSYTLQQNENGFQTMSAIRDSIPDEFGNGFFTCIFEPNGQAMINPLPLKITMVVDHSGSMNYENKMVQAKQALAYIINHLGTSDKFNVISFDHEVQTLWTSPQYTTSSNISSALSFVNNISAILPNGTNLSGAMDSAILDYNNAALTYNNIILLITDGAPTVGITDTYQLVNHFNNLVDQMNTFLSIFSFGVGADVNAPLLTMLSNDHNGNAVFLGSNNIYETVTNYFNQIHCYPMRNPVLTVTPPGAISEVYPTPTPNIFHGSQFILSGRYTTPQTVHINISGFYGANHTTYDFDAQLSETVDPQKEYLAKLWASKKIDNLLLQYYQYEANSTEADQLKRQIVFISQAYGVVCVFTTFTSGTEVIDDTATPATRAIKLLGNFPNPFNPTTTIKFEVLDNINSPAFLNIYNSRGQLVKRLAIRVHGKGTYQFIWDGKNDDGISTASGVYFYKLTVDKYLLTGKMVMMK
ncbi:MAG TPA: VWA domain-containing protein [Candidatus Cloacimonadota bacterium]|nr:VWA domain-containing protein [Candidatus Cloacimonadota bacterium]